MARPPHQPETLAAAEAPPSAAFARAIACATGKEVPPSQAAVVRADLDALGPALIRGHLDRVLLGERADLGIDALEESGILAALLPEVVALMGLTDYEWRHKDVWLHTRRVLIQTPAELHLRWAALLHDIGKPRTRKITADGQVSFIGHPELGARMFERIARRQAWFAEDPELYRSIGFLILHHQRPGQYDETWTDSAVRRFAREMGAHLGDLLDLSRADMTTRHEAKRRKNLLAIDELAARIAALAAEDARVPPLPSGLGDELMQTFHLAPSRLVGEIKRKLESAVDAGELPAQAPPGVYLEFVARQRERFGLPE
jgi:poly(A) polymerase